MEFPHLPDRDYPDQKMESKFQPVGELDRAILSQADEVNGFLFPQFLKIQKQARQHIVDVIHSSDFDLSHKECLFMEDPYMQFYKHGVYLSDTQVNYFCSFVQNLVGHVRDITFSTDTTPKYFHGQQFHYILDFFGRDNVPADDFDQGVEEWHSHYWRNQRASIVHISPVPTEIIDGTVPLLPGAYNTAVGIFEEEMNKEHFSFERPFRTAFDNLIFRSGENAVQQGQVSVRSAVSGQVVCINPLEDIHRRAPVNTEEVSVPFLRHRVAYFHPRNTV